MNKGYELKVEDDEVVKVEYDYVSYEWSFSIGNYTFKFEYSWSDESD